MTAAALVLAALAGCSPPASPPPALYISDERGDRVIVVNPRDGRIVARIAAGKRPRGIRLSPDGRSLYIAVSGSPIGGPGVDDSKLPAADRAADGIAVVDTATATVSRILKAGSDPETFALSADGRTLFVSNEDNSTVSAVDSAGAAPTRIGPVGDQPEGIAVTPDGRHVFVACEGSDSVLMLDARTLQRRTSVTLPGRPRGVLAAANGSVVYVTVEFGGKLAVLSADSGKLLKLIDLARGDTAIRPMGIVEAPGGRTILVTTGRAGAVLEIDTKTGTVVRRIDHVGARLWGIALADRGRTLVTANGPSGDISLIDRTSGKVRARHPAGRSPWGVASSD